MNYRVTRPFRANRPLVPGDVFDATDVNPRRIARLVDRGYLTPINGNAADDSAEPVQPARRSRKAQGEPAPTIENAPVTLAKGTSDA